MKDRFKELTNNALLVASELANEIKHSKDVEDKTKLINSLMTCVRSLDTVINKSNRLRPSMKDAKLEIAKKYDELL